MRSLKKDIRNSLLATTGMLTLASSTLGFAEEEEGNGKEISEEIVVKGIRGSLQRALDIKRNASTIVDGISSEDIGKFPDENLAESLQRITGVSISRESGEGSQVTIRGLGPQFNRVSLNGRTASSGTGGRDFDFSSLASELVSGVEVHKTPTADMDEGGGWWYCNHSNAPSA